MVAHWLRSATGRRRYLGIGRRPGTLYADLDYLLGWRSRVERAVLHLPARAIRAGEAREPDARFVVTGIEEAIGTLRGALLLWTGYYKQTLAVGPVRPDEGSAVFCKVFKEPAEATEETARVRVLAPLLADGARVARAELRSGHVVTYDLAERVPGRWGMDDLMRTAQALGAAALSRACDSRAILAPDEYEVSAAVDLIDKLATAGLAQAFAASIAASAGLPAPVAHGDFTRWNVIRATGGEMVVVDYETVGPWPPFYDLVHLVVQDAVERGEVPVLLRPVAALAKDGVEDAETVVRTALSHDILVTATAHLGHSANRHRTGPALTRKLRALETLG